MIDDSILVNAAQQCATCANLRKFSFDCIAYPDGIPYAIITEKHDHRKPFPGDNGIQFEAIDVDTA